MYPHVRGGAGWGLFCHSDTPVLTRAVGEVICRQTRRQFFSSVSKTYSRPANYQGAYYDGSVRCSGTKYFLSDCDVNIRPKDSCPRGYSTLICTSGYCQYAINHYNITVANIGLSSQPWQIWCPMFPSSEVP